jgi:hypothetical protein
MAIRFRRSNGIYYLINYDKGHRVWRSTGKRRRVDAQGIQRIGYGEIQSTSSEV